MFPIEASLIIHLLSYLKKVENMDKHRWPNLVVKEELSRQKIMWMKQNKKWLGKWDINLHDCPHTKEEMKKWVLEKFRITMGTKQVGRKNNILCQRI